MRRALPRSPTPPSTARRYNTLTVVRSPPLPPPPPPLPSLFPPDVAVSPAAIRDARGLAFLTSYTVGFFGGVSASHGILLARKPGSREWGLPVAVSGGGACAILGLGYREDTSLFVLDTDAAVEATFGNHSLKLGLVGAAALGPVGRAAGRPPRTPPPRRRRRDGAPTGAHSAADAKATARSVVGAHQYGYSKGAFAGAGVELSYYSTRDADTRAFYGVDAPSAPGIKPPSARAILRGECDAVDVADFPEVRRLVEAVEAAAGEGRANGVELPGGYQLRGSTWETSVNF